MQMNKKQGFAFQFIAPCKAIQRRDYPGAEDRCESEKVWNFQVEKLILELTL